MRYEVLCVQLAGGGADQLLLAAAHPCVQCSVAARLRHRQHQATHRNIQPQYLSLQQMCPQSAVAEEDKKNNSQKRFRQQTELKDLSLYPTPTLIGGECSRLLKQSCIIMLTYKPIKLCFGKASPCWARILRCVWYRVRMLRLVTACALLSLSWAQVTRSPVCRAGYTLRVVDPTFEPEKEPTHAHAFTHLQYLMALAKWIHPLVLFKRQFRIMSCWIL